MLPTLLTLGNVLCGFGAITLSAKWGGFDQNTSLFAAACLIYMAMVFDALDGSAARWTKQTSEFGAQLDSLCDAISFGAAPAFLMLQFSVPYGYHPRLLWLAAGLYVVCTVLRLARFNVEEEDENLPGLFSGLPSPAAAGVVASFPVMVFGPQLLAYSDYDLVWAEFAATLDAVAVRTLPLIAFAVACLMVSRVRYLHLFHTFVRGRRNGPYLIKLVFALVMIVAAPRISAPLICCWYAFATPVWALWDKHLRRFILRRPPAAEVR